MTNINKHYLYRTWDSMKTRCYNEKHQSYKDYGARGITVSEEWRNSFLRFVNDMGQRPEGYTLDRKNNDGNYCAGNCKWSSTRTQSHNRRNNNRCVGVFYNKRYKSWCGQASIGSRQYYLGSYQLWWDAVCARKSWEHRVGL